MSKKNHFCFSIGFYIEISNSAILLFHFKIIFFSYINSLDEETFKNIQDDQKLCISFKEYGNLCKKLFNNCINQPER